MAATLRLEDVEESGSRPDSRTRGDSPCGWQPPVGFRLPQEHGSRPSTNLYRAGGMPFTSQPNFAATLRLDEADEQRSGVSSRMSARGDKWPSKGAAASCPRSPGMHQSTSSPLLHGVHARPGTGLGGKLRPGSNSGTLRLAGNQLAGGAAHGPQLCVPDFGRLCPD